MRLKIFFIQAFFVAGLIAEAKEFTCEPRQEIKDIVKVLDDENIDLNERRKRIKAILQEFPEDTFAHAAYQRFVKNFDHENYDVELKKYKELLDTNPDDPAYLYIYGSFLKDEEQAIPYLEKALEKSSSFPQIYEYLVWHYTWTDPEISKANQFLKKWMDACPMLLEPYDYVRSSDDIQLVNIASENLRKILSEKEIGDSTEFYEQLWSLEFLKTAPTKHDSVRARVRADVERLLQGLDKLSLEQLNILKIGFESIPDELGKARIEDEIIRRYPDDYETGYIVSRRWDREHPEPDTNDWDAFAKWQQEYMAATKDWIAKWPNNSTVRWYRLSSMHGVENVSANEILKAVDDVLSAKEETGYYTPQEFTIAEILIDNKLRLHSVSKLIDQGIAKGLKRIESRKDESQNAYLQKNLNWRADVLRTSAALATNNLKEADTILARLNVALSNTVNELDKGWEAARTAEYSALLAQKAEQSGNMADALLHYYSSIQAMPDKRAVQRKALRAWRSLKGTDEGWKEFIKPKNQTVELKPLNIPLPDFQLSDLNGKGWQTSDFKNKIAFINVWATWCGPCLSELPFVEQLYKKLHNRKDIIFVTLNVDENQGLVYPFMKKNGYTFPVISSIALIEKIRPEWGVPINWIVKDSIIIKEMEGFESEKRNIWADAMYKAITEEGRQVDR